MDVFELRDRLIGDYRHYATSFLTIRDDRVHRHVDEAFDEGRLWPPPRVGLNPAFRAGGTIDELVAEGLLHERCRDIFTVGKSETDGIGEPMTLHQHQVDAIRAARRGENYVLTTGTGSGKSLSYIVPAVDHVLRHGSGDGIKALIVYPMNALANSQVEELRKFLHHGPWGAHPPVTFSSYTGQLTDQDEKQDLLDRPPDILLTNYVMLELILTRPRDRKLVQAMGDMRFLVFDELHTYRGRQGADVSMLVRRTRQASRSSQLLCVGTSATMASSGGYEDRRNTVARVASTIFGAEVTSDGVIGETLQRATLDRSIEDPAFVSELAAQIRDGVPPATDVDSFVAQPLSSWIESTLGLHDDDGRLERAVPKPLVGKEGQAARLAELTGESVDRCEAAIQAQLMAGFGLANERRFPVFAFRLHQFLSRGDTVYATPESVGSRYLSLNRQRFAPGSDQTKVLLPLAFCRECGQDHYVAEIIDTGDGPRLIPRELNDSQGEDGEAVFVFVTDEAPWPDDADDMKDRLPEDWYDADERLKSDRRNDVPHAITVAPDGRIDPESGPSTRAWWTPTPFRFCSVCGVSYAGRLGRDFARLSTLGSDGRSTATTIMSMAAVQQLRATGDLPPAARKLLSFTDNRQDASLQAGHFNDFVQVTMLRRALYRAAVEAGADGLAHDELAPRVFAQLGLPFGDYAREPDLKGAAAKDTDRALRGVLAYRLYRDLERGWRLTQPNLEQCGLLRIEYESLDELAADNEIWADAHAALAGATAEDRRRILAVLLDTIRRDLAIEVDALREDELDRLRQRADQRLVGLWALADEKLSYAPTIVPRPRSKGDVRDTVFMSSRGGYGQFLRKASGLGGPGIKLSLDDTTEIIDQIFEGLRRYGLLNVVGDHDSSAKRYQLPASALRWVAGDGSAPYRDLIRMPNAPEGRRTNEFFGALYTSETNDLIGIEAREHTAQVPYELREEREKRFRSADLPVLYCSPTMELGVDISRLNVVNLRNVPPTPANYAQRSGRAGRSGQPALVFTYCTAGSPHDQHYFHHPDQMVAGQVEAPRLELANQDLLEAHVRAVWLSSSRLDLGSSLSDVLDLADDVDDPPVFPRISAHLTDATIVSRAKQEAEAVLADLGPTLDEAPWWYEEWLDDTLRRLADEFEQALQRWRTLYKAALQQAREQSAIKQSASSTFEQKRSADRLRREAENQLELLRAESDKRFQSDFYTYRYLAAEGFLPGYSFPRLPLSAFIPAQRSGNPEFLQRPRFLAISEFGPQSYVYHEGARFRINRVILPVGDLTAEDGGLITQEAKRCTTCGYLHPLIGTVHADVCVRCGQELPNPYRDLFRLQNVSTVRRDRITSDEEERQRKGYEIESGIHFAARDGRPSVTEAVVESNGAEFLRLAYGDTATIWRINRGWRRRKHKETLGFVLDVQRGYWGNANDADVADDEDPLSNQTKRVIPYVEDTRNVLLVEPVLSLDNEQMASLQAALKVAVQTVFQLEEDEIASEPLPGPDRRNVMLFYESAEGGAGALRRLVDEPELWPRIAAEALRRCHVDPETGAELEPPSGDACEAACYDCLLSYRNQTEHDLLRRQSARPLLDRLRSADLRPTDTARRRLDEGVESTLEAEFLRFLREHGYREPTSTQPVLDDITRADFGYGPQRAVVFIDGPHHDDAERRRRDDEIDGRVRELGLSSIRFGHRDDWERIASAHPEVFGPGDRS